MKRIGSIVLSYEETGDLSGVIPWKIDDSTAIQEALKREGIPLSGFLYISTCNRVEFLYTLENPDLHGETMEALLRIMPPLRSDVYPAHYVGHRAVRHMLRLASGLESMVLGETEIRAQIKDSFEDARGSNNLDKRLRLLLQSIFQESRHIRNSIPMTNLPLSVATLATKSLSQFPGFDAPGLSGGSTGTVVVIGSGPMSRQSAEYLSRDGHKIVLVNRSLDKIRPLAERLQCGILDFDAFLAEPDRIGPIRAIITATSRPDAFLTSEVIRTILEGNGGRGLALVDLALPPDVDTSVTSLPGVHLISMETLRVELDENRQKRVMAARLAESYVDEALYRVEANLIAGLSGPIMKEIQKDIRNRSRDQLARLLDERLSHLSKKDRNLIYTWAIQAHRELNRIHKKGLESVIRSYFADDRKLEEQEASISRES